MLKWWLHNVLKFEIDYLKFWTELSILTESWCLRVGRQKCRVVCYELTCQKNCDLKAEKSSRNKKNKPANQTRRNDKISTQNYNGDSDCSIHVFLHEKNAKRKDCCEQSNSKWITSCDGRKSCQQNCSLKKSTHCSD